MHWDSLASLSEEMLWAKLEQTWLTTMRQNGEQWECNCRLISITPLMIECLTMELGWWKTNFSASEFYGSSDKVWERLEKLKKLCIYIQWIVHPGLMRFWYLLISLRDIKTMLCITKFHCTHWSGQQLYLLFREKLNSLSYLVDISSEKEPKFDSQKETWFCSFFK